jgi:hypothetical protein
MNYRFTLFLFLVVSFSGLLAQNKFEEGYVVTKSNDTIAGFIEYLSWSGSPKKITFRNSRSNQITTYSPVEINSFYIKSSDEYYRGLIANIDYSPHEISKMRDYESDADFFREYRPVLDTVFLKTLIQGKVSLFYYKDFNNKSHFFVEKESMGIKELEYQQYMVQGKVKYLKGYQELLKDYTKECSSLVSRINNINYFRSQLLSLISNYNSCTGSGNVYVKGKSKHKFSIYLNPIIGISISHISPSIQSSNYPQFSTINFNFSSKPTFGLAFDIFFPSKRKEWALSTQLLYQGWSFNGVEEDPSFTTIDRLEYKLNANFVKAQLLGKYMRTNSGKVHPFINAGLSFNSKLNSSFQEIKTYTVGSPETSNIPFQVSTTSMVIGTGASTHRWQGEIRYESNLGSKSLSTKTITAKQSVFSFLLNYRIGLMPEEK